MCSCSCFVGVCVLLFELLVCLCWCSGFCWCLSLCGVCVRVFVCDVVGVCVGVLVLFVGV